MNTITSIFLTERIFKMENEFEFMVTRFHKLASERQDFYREEARRLMPPHFHNDQDLIFLTALQLMLNDEYLKGGGTAL